MAQSFTNLRQLQQHLQSVCRQAVCDTAEAAMNKLKECVEEQYYNDPDFYPEFYRRTEEFLNSAAWQLLSPTSAQVSIDTALMHYKNNFSPTQIVEWAGQSMHGGELYQTDTQDFWSAFLEWCDQNLIQLLRQNLQKHGINLK